MRVLLIFAVLLGAFRNAAEPDHLVQKIYAIIHDKGLNYTLEQVEAFSRFFFRMIRDINDRAHLNLSENIRQLKQNTLNLPDKDLRGIEYNNKVYRLYRIRLYEQLLCNATLGKERNALDFEATLLNLLRNNSQQRRVDASAQEFLNMTQLQLTQQICGIYELFIQEDLKDHPIRNVVPLLRALNASNKADSERFYERLVNMVPPPATTTERENSSQELTLSKE